ncbi:MAG TPA: hypothetical protein VLF39_03250, partial [Candidatus Saccharimonadales bacterium]|nr:hypothetical protein [Candidatus Saccharimonadales bacterium]
DTTALTENTVVTPQAPPPLSITTSDTTNLSELVIMLAGDDEGMFETVTISENVVVVVTAPPTLTISTNDSPSITESSNVVIQTISNLLITVNETINTAEAKSVSINNLLLAIAVSDSVTSTESLSLTITAINLAIKFLEFFE